MKNSNALKSLSILVFLLLGSSSVSFAQFSFGIRGGLSTDNFKKDAFTVQDDNGHSQFSLGLKDATYGYHFGGFVRIGDKFYVQPELMFNSNSINYEYDSLSASAIGKKIFSETHHRVDMPLIFGVKLGNFISLQAGPVGHFHINNASELTDIQGYKEKWDTFTYGYQAGLGLEFWKFIVDLRYEGNFSKRGDHISFFGKDYNFDNSPSRLLLSVGLRF